MTANFDGIANKFDKNIYGTTKGKLRHHLLLHYLQSWLTCSTPLRVLDLGGGTGMMSLAFAAAGHKVTLVDSSDDVLEIARQRLNEFTTTTLLKCDVMALGNMQHYDLVLCHAVLEWLDKPFDLLHKLTTEMRPDASLSLSFFNQHAMYFSNVLYGNFEYIAQGLKVRNKVRLNPHNPLSPSDVISYLQGLENSQIVHQAGIRCFHDYMFDRSMQQSHFDHILEQEIEYGCQHPYMWLGKYFHLMLTITDASLCKNAQQ